MPDEHVAEDAFGFGDENKDARQAFFDKHSPSYKTVKAERDAYRLLSETEKGRRRSVAQWCLAKRDQQNLAGRRRVNSHYNDGYQMAMEDCARMLRVDPEPSDRQHDYSMPHDMRYASDPSRYCPPNCPGRQKHR